ncbi:MAG: type I-E CRISPR-associated protein Cse2/CasB [Oscillospiraceae bacterium]|jgi:CRISPR system Cascade subunit CasB|nr:type I-E CRISPR-associated protein Cse2/CasB [Oscillospiraceae bacterium]
MEQKSDPAAQVYGFVRGKVQWLYDSRERSGTKATFARLRRGLGKQPGELPELWEATLNGLPEELLSHSYDGAPSYGENAVHTALTLFALHQQGKDRSMYQKDMPFGKAVRRLAPDSNSDKFAGVKRRFDAAATAQSFTEAVQHLRGLVQLLKASDIPLDYPALASELWRFQFPAQQNRVRLGWGQDFWRGNNTEDIESEENPNEQQ